MLTLARLILAALLVPCAALAQRTGGSFGARAWGSRPAVVSRPVAAPSRPATRVVWAPRVYATAPRPTAARDVARTVVAVRRVYRSAPEFLRDDGFADDAERERVYARLVEVSK